MKQLIAKLLYAKREALTQIKEVAKVQLEGLSSNQITDQLRELANKVNFIERSTEIFHAERGKPSDDDLSLRLSSLMMAKIRHF